MFEGEGKAIQSMLPMQFDGYKKITGGFIIYEIQRLIVPILLFSQK